MSLDSSVLPPKMKKQPYSRTLHGQELNDPYFWFRFKEDPAVLEHLQLENDYTAKLLLPYTEMQTTLFNELKQRTLPSDQSFPVKYGDYFYYSKEVEGKEYPIYCRKFKSLESCEETLLDLNHLAKGKDYLELGSLKISPHHKILAFSLDYDGSEEFTIFFKDLITGDVLPDRIKKTYPNFEWCNDSRHIYYLTLNEKHIPAEVYRWDLDNPGQPRLIYKESDPDYHLGLYKSMTQNFLFLQSSTHATTETQFMSANSPQEHFNNLSPRKRGVIYNVEDSGRQTFIIHTNDEAINFKIMEARYNSLNEESWSELLPHDEGIYIKNLEVFKDHILLEERHFGLPRLRDLQLSSKRTTSLKLPEENCHLGSYVNYEFDSPCFYFSYSSLVTPPSVLAYEFATSQVKTCKSKEIPTYRKEDYMTQRIFAKSYDGTEVPISLLYRKDLNRNGENPCYLYGYGSYGININPYFRQYVLSLVDRGFVFAIAHVRGGAIMGREWYEQGKLKNKRNSFYDFMACAEHLIQEKITYKQGIVISGASAGGLLVGATINMKPDLFKAVVAHVPFVDNLNTMLDDTLPLTTIEYDEWGNPNTLEDFKYIKSYAVYENIQKQDYPAMYVTAGFNDPRVTYWEPAKWVAKLREYKTDSNPILLKTHLGAGHRGHSGRFEHLKDFAEEYTFVLAIFGLI